MALILAYKGKQPNIAADAFIAPTATIIGDVTIESGANVWYGAVLRGDAGKIHIGARTSVQDNVVIHVNHRHPTIIEADVTIGHGAVLEGCHIKQGVLIGMNATVLSGVIVGAGTLVAAGAVLREESRVPDGVLVTGVPATVKTKLSAELKTRLAKAPHEYQQYAQSHRIATQDLSQESVEVGNTSLFTMSRAEDEA